MFRAISSGPYAVDVKFRLDELTAPLEDEKTLFSLVVATFPGDYDNFKERLGVLGLDDDAGGSLRTTTPPTLNRPPPARVCMGMGIHPEGIKSCSDLGRVLVLNGPAAGRFCGSTGRGCSSGRATARSH